MSKRDGRGLNGAHRRFKILMANHIHRARQLGVEGGFRFEDWMAILQHYAPDNCCLACGEPKALTIDHVIPLTVEGATNWPGNLQPLCKPCNTRKGTKVIDYRPDLGEFAARLTEKRKRDPGPWQKFVYLKPIWEKRERERGRVLRTSDMAERINIDSREMQRLKCGYADFPHHQMIIALCDLFFCRKDDIVFDTFGHKVQEESEKGQLFLFDAVSREYVT